jgi:hypothetical protein
MVCITSCTLTSSTAAQEKTLGKGMTLYLPWVDTKCGWLARAFALVVQ